jgi:peptide/nickel transport system ATP-binding protein
MKELKEKLGTAMLLITHDLGVVAEICDKVAIMYAGQVIEQGMIEDIFESEHHHPYTEGLFGAIPNLSEKIRRLSPVEGLMPDPTDLPTGCFFHVRCRKCMDICKTIEPEVKWVNGDKTHSIKCHLFNDYK